MARPALYYFAPSAPCRIALLAARNLGVDVEVKDVHLFKKEQFNDDFLKLNPQHTVPLLVDDDFVLSESRVIATYLVEKNYPAGHSFYPLDAKKRAIINNRMYYEATVLYPRIRAICRPALFEGVTRIADKDRQSLLEAVDYIDKHFFKGHKYAAESDELTLADISLLAMIATFASIGGNLNNYPNIAAWYELCKDLPGNSENLAGAKQFGDAVKNKLEETL